MICVSCRSIVNKACNPLDFTFRHSTQLGDARKSAAEDCYMCQSVVCEADAWGYAIQDTTACDWEIEKDESVDSWSNSATPVVSTIGWLNIYMKLEGAFSLTIMFALSTVENSEISVTKQSTLIQNAENGDASERYMPPTYSGHETSLALIERWLMQCMQDHKKCNLLQDPTWMPTRLIEIISSTMVRIIDTKDETWIDQPVQYTTVSHVWGNHQPASLKTSNHTYMKEGFDIGSLPQTFIDAVLVTRRLGFCYLWIDSLCILQDSEEDWRVESAQMMNVYECSSLNLGATLACNSLVGLFHHRDIADLVLPQVVATLQGGRTQTLIFSKNDIPLFENEMDGPLLKRGWVLQEQLLSRRMIHFCSDQIYWRCRHGISHEAHASVRGPQELLRNWPNLIQYMLESLNSNSGSPFDRWQELCIHYSSLSLTYGTDKLVAFSGLAARFARQHKISPHDYLAGMWNCRIIDFLLWYSSQPASTRNDEIPSWSWAAINQAISFGTPAFDYEEPHPPQYFRSSVINTRIDLKDENQPFGQILSGSLTLEVLMARIHGNLSTPLQDGIEVYLSSTETNHPIARIEIVYEGNLATDLCVYWDFEATDSKHNGSHLAAALDVQKLHDEKICFHALLLSTEGDCYTREGLLQFAIPLEEGQKLLQRDDLRKQITIK